MPIASKAKADEVVPLFWRFLHEEYGVVAVAG
jgi:hypothetical protein